MNTQIDRSPIRPRCSECGRSNSSGASVCETCGSILPLFSFDATPRGTTATHLKDEPPQLQAVDLQPWPWNLPETTGAPAHKPCRSESAPSQEPDTAVHPQADLVGHVILAEAPYQEKPDFDWYEFFTRLLWFLLLVVSPFLLLHFVLMKLGALSAILAVVGMIYLLRFITPMNLLSLLHLHAVLNPFRRQEREMVPVRYLRVRDDNEAEHMARMKGELRLGNVSPDDLVSLWGSWHRGTLFVTRGYNHRTRSHIEIQGSQSWIWFAITVTIVLFLICYFWEPTRVLTHRLHELGGRL